MNTETTTISIRLSPEDLARVDEMRGTGVSRSAFVRELLRKAGPMEGAATHAEALEILTRQARGGIASAAVALERATRPVDGRKPPDTAGELARLLGGDSGDDD